VVGGWIVLKNASWVHWTGRLSTLCSRMTFASKGWPAGHPRPRTEYVGDGVRISLSKVVDSICKDWHLPSESVQA